MNAAMLLANESANMVVGRATTPPPKGYRFPIFAPGEGDYEPSADHYAVMSNALTYMLVQSLDDADETIAILPAWPCRWDVQFKVHGPKQTVITGELLHGALVGELQVTPESPEEGREGHGLPRASAPSLTIVIINTSCESDVSSVTHMDMYADM